MAEFCRLEYIYKLSSFRVWAKANTWILKVCARRRSVVWLMAGQRHRRWRNMNHTAGQRPVGPEGGGGGVRWLVGGESKNCQIVTATDLQQMHVLPLLPKESHQLKCNIFFELCTR